jgi:hypothetical protein
MDVYEIHKRTQRTTEHGRDWLICLDCGASWSIVETDDGEELEEIDGGDDFCNERTDSDD